MDTDESVNTTGSSLSSGLTYTTPGGRGGGRGGATGLRSHGGSGTGLVTHGSQGVPPLFGTDGGDEAPDIPGFPGMPQMPPVMGMNPLGVPDVVPAGPSWGQGHVLGDEENQPVPNIGTPNTVKFCFMWINACLLFHGTDPDLI